MSPAIRVLVSAAPGNVSGAPGLLPFFQGRISLIARPGVDQPLRHGPALVEKELLRHLAQLGLEERELLGRHRVGVDPGPDGMAMPPSFLFMEDDDAGLIDEAQALLDILQRLFEHAGPARFQFPAG